MAIVSRIINNTLARLMVLFRTAGFAGSPPKHFGD